MDKKNIGDKHSIAKSAHPRVTTWEGLSSFVSSIISAPPSSFDSRCRRCTNRAQSSPHSISSRYQELTSQHPNQHSLQPELEQLAGVQRCFRTHPLSLRWLRYSPRIQFQFQPEQL